MPVTVISVISSNSHPVSCNRYQSVDRVGIAVNLKFHGAVLRVKEQDAFCCLTGNRTRKSIGHCTCGIAVISTCGCAFCNTVCMKVRITSTVKPYRQFRSCCFPFAIGGIGISIHFKFHRSVLGIKKQDITCGLAGNRTIYIGSTHAATAVILGIGRICNRNCMHIGIRTTRTGDVILSVGYQYGTSVDVGRLVILNLHLTLRGIHIKDIAICLITDRSCYSRSLGSINGNSNSCSVISNLGCMPVAV